MWRRGMFSVCYRLVLLALRMLLLLQGGVFIGTAMSTPVRGLTSCLNHEDCLGANRHCHRNASMTIGRCICDGGFERAKDDDVRCIRGFEEKCERDEDCPFDFFHCRENQCISKYESRTDSEFDFHRVNYTEEAMALLLLFFAVFVLSIAFKAKCHRRLFNVILPPAREERPPPYAHPDVQQCKSHFEIRPEFLPPGGDTPPPPYDESSRMPAPLYIALPTEV